MSEEQTASTETQSAPDATQQQTAPKASNSGYDHIDFATASPEEISERFSRLYKQVKAQDRKLSTLGEYKTIAKSQAEMIAELQSGMGKVVGHLQGREVAETEASVRKEAQDAYNRGDSDGYLAATERLAELKAEKKFRELQSANQPKEPQQPKVPSNATDVGEGLDDEDMGELQAWQAEKDDSGQPLRPWAYNPLASQGKLDPGYQEALMTAKTVFESPRWKDRSLAERLSEVDRRMGVTRSTPSQNVLGANLTSSKKPSRIALSPEMEKLAIRTKYGGPKAKTDADHIAAYKAQMDKVKSQSKQGDRR